MKLRKHLEEADVVKFKSKRQENLEKEIYDTVKVIFKYLLTLSILEKKLMKKKSPANDMLLDVIAGHITDITNFIGDNWPVDYKGLKKRKLR
jgi:hypothetical protein